MARAALLLWLALASPSARAQEAESAKCAGCHREICDSYRRTPMAQSSGRPGGGLIQEDFARARFAHRPSGFRYQVSRNRQRYFVDFENGSLHGRKALAYFVGSGATARSYLLAADGFLYEAPVAYYTAGAKWDLAPAYDHYAYPYTTRPIVPGCLDCHASFIDLVPGTQNRYGTPPFGQAGVACERCHGPGGAHIASMESGGTAGGPGIVNPAKLAPDRRDSICAQCHLTGEARVMRAGRDWRSFHAGDRLWDSMTVFVQSGGTPGMRVTSHVEKLAQSACKRAAGDRLWCGTCHDPHVVPKPAERAAWFRAKCLGCHEPGACREPASARAANGDDCTRCHMPKNPVVDAQHVVYTDHSIPRRPRIESASPAAEVELVPFGGGPAPERDLALAYGITARRDRALPLLELAAREAPDDVEVLLYLAELYRNGDQPDRAIPLYQRAIRLDPAQVTASVGLGGILMERGQNREAARLFQDALSKNAGLVLVRTNLAMAQWKAGDLRSAETSLMKAVELSPGFAAARDLLAKLRQAAEPH